MNKFRSLLLLLCGVSTLHAQTIYVKPNGTGNGTSWANAAGNLRTVLNTASSGAQIWVAAGTYYPTRCTNCTTADRQISFEIPPNVAVYGGFAGTETAVNQRVIENHPTILSGDIDGNKDTTHHSQNLVYVRNVDSTTIFDGFTLSNAYADGTQAYSERFNSGAALYLNGSLDGGFCRIRIRNCRFENNKAKGYAAAILMNGGFRGSCNPSLSNCLFENNVSVAEGGAINHIGYYDGECSPKYEFCRFKNNHSLAAGGAIFSDGIGGKCNAEYRQCEWRGNIAKTYGGAIYHLARMSGENSPFFYNCLFIGNQGFTAGALYFLASDSGTALPKIVHCTFTANQAKYGVAVYANAGDTQTPGLCAPEITNSILYGNIAMYGYGRSFRNVNGQIRIQNSLIEETDAATANSGTSTVAGYGTLTAGNGMLYNQNPKWLSTTDLVLLPESPLIDRGAAAVLKGLSAIDLEGQPRIQGNAPDLGAYEFDPAAVIAPSITTQPTSLMRCANDFAQFSVSAKCSNNNYLTYQWLKGTDEIQGAKTPMLQFATATPGDEGNYQCRVTNRYGRVSTTDLVHLQVQPRAIFEVAIAHDRQIVCEGDSATFLATSNNGGNAQYEWFKNNVLLKDVTTNTLKTNDLKSKLYKCRITSDALCIQQNVLSTNQDSIQTIDRIAATAWVTHNNVRVCRGDSLVFKAIVQRAGANPQYQWLFNDGVVAGKTDSILKVNTSNDVRYACRITSSEQCPAQRVIVSNEDSAQPIERVKAMVEVTHPAESVCRGDSVVFKATAFQAGLKPQYKWFLNGHQLAQQKDSIIKEVAMENRKVTCQVVSSEQCPLTQTVVSNEAVAAFRICRVGTDEILTEQLKIYPNPLIDNVLQIEIPGNGFVKIVDSTGKMVWEQATSTADTQLQLSNDLASGLYQIFWTDGVHYARAKLIRVRN
jgi:Secretion system C-terminal sorting domain